MGRSNGTPLSGIICLRILIYHPVIGFGSNAEGYEWRYADEGYLTNQRIEFRDHTPLSGFILEQILWKNVLFILGAPRDNTAQNS
jgi:hypothetical protein